MKRLKIALALSCGLLVMSTLASTRVHAQTKDLSPLLAGLTRTVKGKQVGPNKFFIIDERSTQNACGTPYQRVDTGLEGTIDGYTAASGHRNEEFVDDPEVIFQRTNLVKQYSHGIATYHADQNRKHGMVIYYPASAKDWNGRVMMIFHGAGLYSDASRELIPRKCGQFTPYSSQDFGNVGPLIDKGYAVVHTRRAGLNPKSVYSGRGQKVARRPPEMDSSLLAQMESVTLDNGTEVAGKTFNWHAGLARDYALVAEKFLQSRLGRKPDWTYFYGHSAGGNLCRTVNYVKGANVGADGKPVYDGLLCDDAAAGIPMFTKYVDGKDVLFQTDADKKNFVPMVEIAHAAYPGDDYASGALPGGKGGDYMYNRRMNQVILNAKGLGAQSRTYEVLGVSHADAGRRKDPAFRANNVDMAGFFDALVDNFDAWVTRGVEPPPTRSDWREFGRVNQDGVNENAAIALPEVACPTGVYYLFPKGTPQTGSTGFAPYLREERLTVNATTESLPDGFKEEWLEPLNMYGYLIDMNGNGTRDTRESITQAWQRRAQEGHRTGVLKLDGQLTHAKYVACVSDVASNLQKQRLISEKAMGYYIEQATASDIGK